MYSGFLRALAFSACVVAPGLSLAQVDAGSGNRVAAHTDWSVFETEAPKQCWSVSSPKETVNTRDGAVVRVQRGEILFFVSYVPDTNVRAQVSFTGGYPFRDGSTVELKVGDETFDFFTVPEDDPSTPVREDEIAWAQDETADEKIISAMKAGAEAVVTAVSQRGTQTEDVFSLFGFTAAVEEAASRCEI